MEWQILALVSWVLFLLLVDCSALKCNIWCGLVAVLLQIFVDNIGVSHGLYEIRKCSFCIAHSSFFFTMGPIIVIGTLMPQYHPKTRVLRILNVLMLTALYTLQEILLLARENVVYNNWHFADSVGVNLVSMVFLSWFIMIVMNRGSEKGDMS
ncbi:MAG TPA: hypothetical protein VEG39_10585 [Clostridia bacterium]|nr:hypothetical protein [Clostridia bacterium]